MNIVMLKDNQEATVTSIDGDRDTQFRLMELGFTPGTWIKVCGRSLFSSPVFVEVRGAVISLRESEARCILVKTKN